jgi:hypothetical protein
MCGFLDLENFVGVIYVGEFYGRAHPKEQAKEHEDKQKKPGGGR